MKNNYTYKAYLCLIFIVSLFLKSHAQSPGDIAFIAFNADGDDDFAIVALTELAANSTIYITDKESDGAGGITSGEGTLTWFTGTTSIKAGTVVVFTDVDNGTNPNFGVSIGLLSETGAFNINSSKEGILAFVGTDDSSPTSFIAAIQIGNDPSNLGPFDGDEITLTNTGLVIGTSIIVVDSSASPDGAVYNASRASQTSYNEYYTLLIDDDSNWTNVVNGDGETLLPFSSEAFTIHTTIWTGTTSNAWNISSNWSNGLPTSSSLATVPDVTTSPIINSGTEAVVGNMTIDTGENLTINSDNSMSVSGLLTINGSLEMNSGSSLLVLGTSTGNITYNRTLATTNWYLMSSPVIGETYDNAYVTANSIASGTGDNRGIALYTPSDDSWDYMQSGETATFAAGNGYSVKRSATGDISFTGTLNVADVGVTLSNAGNRFNLLGNPYTSHIASATFLTNEAAVSETQTLWVWNQATGASGAYEVKTISDAMIIAPAQGFFVKANAAGGTFNFAESNQASTGGTFQRTENRQEIYLTISNQTDAREAKIYYIENMTTGFDVGYEGELFNGVSNPLAIYTHLVADSEGKNYQVQSLPTNNYENMIVPVGVNATSGSAITIDASTNNLPEGVNIYLEDKQDNSFTLLNADTNFNSTLENDLSGIGRFYLHTTSESLSTAALGIDSNISIYKSSSDNIRIVGVQNGTANVQMYNMLGKEVLKTSFEGNGVNDIKLNTIPMGIYIVKIATENGTLNRKIIIQ